MTKRDFVAIAGECNCLMQELYDRGKYAELEGAHKVTCRLVDLFEATNNKFNRDKFWKAAGFSAWSVK